MRRGSIADLRGKLADIQVNLKRFVTHDVRRNPMLLLYFVVGAIIVGYLFHFLMLVVRDLSSEKKEQVASKPGVEQVQRARPARKPAEVKPEESAAKPAPAEVPAQGTAEQATKVSQERQPTKANEGATGAGSPKASMPQGAAPAAEKAAPKIAPSAATGSTGLLDSSNWRKFSFPDSSNLSFPRDWKESEIPAQKNMPYGIRLQVPGADASIQCYSTRKQIGDDLTKSLRATMGQDGFVNIEEKNRKISRFDAVELSGVLADKHMVVTVFDYRPDVYFIASLIATDKDYQRQRPYYDTILSTYTSGGTGQEPISLQDIEKSIRKGIQQTESSLIGKMVEITLEDGTKHRGVVIAEDDASYTLENYRFGGRYSFTVKKASIARISR
jgi:cytoskeletal protein RodZ